MNNYEQNYSYQETDHHTTESVRDLGRITLGSTVEMRQNKEVQNDSFDLTLPESRTYSPYEDYRFLVHVAKDNIAERASEIGSPRDDGILMTSLVSNRRQATFLGEGGIIVAEPNPELVTGIAAFDVGGENKSEAKADIGELLTPASNSDYNQVDMKFEATEPIGVMIKRTTTDGRELGSPAKNASLREYAAQHNLPVVETLILPDILPSELASRWEEMDDGNRLLSVTVPDTEEQYYSVQVLHGQAYGVVEGEDTMARVMKLSAYGEASQELSPAERQKALAGLEQLLNTPDSGVTQKDITTVNRDLNRLEKQRFQR